MPKRSKNSPATEAVRSAVSGIPRTRPMLIGVSGGRDSMVLLHALKSAGANRLIVCHLDHGLRGRDSRRDAEFVRRSARGMAFESAKAGTRAYARAHGLSLETAARELRLAFFQECSRRRGCRTLLLAHHGDDQVETCLFNYLRGSGAAGLAGMRRESRRGSLRIIRPLLGISRKLIDSYAAEHAVRYRDDTSNLQPVHTRNRIRHELIPAIERIFGPGFREAVLRSAGILRAEDEFLETLVQDPGSHLSCEALRLEPEALQRRTVIRWLRQGGVPEPGFAEAMAVLSLLDPASGPAKVNLPGGIHARRREKRIFLEHPRKKQPGRVTRM